MSKNFSWKRLLICIIAAFAFYNPSVLAQEELDKERPMVGYDKGFFVSSGRDYAFRVNGRMQTRGQYSYQDKSQHVAKLYVPIARLMFAGHVFDPRIAFGTQLAFEDGFKLIEFVGNFGLFPDDIYLKVGHFAPNYSLLEARSHAKLEFVDRTAFFKDWNIGGSTGFSLHRNKKNLFSFDLAVFENGISAISNKRLGGASLNVAVNYNEMDPSDEADFIGGPLRAMFSLGGFGRAQIETWKLVGYGGAVETMAKFFYTSINAGFFTGIKEAPKSPTSTATEVVQKPEIDELKLAAYGQLGYVLFQNFGLAARYALATNYKQAPLEHEMLGSASTYFFGHNLKLQIDGGGKLKESNFTPEVRAQLQLAF